MANTPMEEPAAPAEVFISYAHQDRDRARAVVAALQRQGFAVWWDQNIVEGQNWENEIENALRRSRAVIVLWSAHSVASDEVRREANFALKQKKLVPARLDNIELPIRYHLTQTTDLRAWDGSDGDEAWRGVLGGVRGYLGGTQARAHAADQPAAPDKPAAPGGGIRIAWAWLVVPTLIAGATAIALAIWKAPTEIVIEVTCSRAGFRSAEDDRKVLFPAGQASSIVLRGFSEVRLPAAEVEAADPERWDMKTDQYPADAWRRLTPSMALVLRPAGGSPAQLTLQPSPNSANLLMLDDVYLPAAMALSSPEKDTLNLDLRGKGSGGAIALPERVKVIADDCSVEGAALPWAGPSHTLRLWMPRQPRLLAYDAHDAAGVTLAVGLPPDREAAIAQPFRISQVEFLKEGPTAPLSSITGGKITYPEQQGRQLSLTEGDYLILEELRSFYLRKVEFTGERRLLRMHFTGTAGRASSGPGRDRLQDLRVSWFERLWGNQKLAALFTLLAWAAATVVGLRKYLKEHAGR